LNDLNEIAESSSINPLGDYTHAQSTKLVKPMTKNAASRRDSCLDSVAESDYKYIPNNFKMKEGVAFQVTGNKINFDAGISGIYNMGNTCFMSTGKLGY
jgi:ubiquitin C-terminal hydrolase